MSAEYKILKKKKIHDGFFQLHELTLKHKKHDGKWSNPIKREIFGGAQVAGIIPYDPIKKEILLLSQFRVALISANRNPLMTEIVAGMIDKNESPENAAKRECLEETGCNVGKIIPINSFYPAPGSSESFYHLFLGEVESFKGEKIFGQKNENEDILVKSFNLKQVRDLMTQKKILNGLTLIALQWFFLEYYKD